MSSYEPLETLLAVKRAAEDAAAQALAAALRRRAAAEATQLRLDQELGAARDDLRSRRQAGAPPGVETAARAIERERFWTRLAQGIAARSARAHDHRQGPFAGAEVGAAAALAAHQTARAARELVQKLCERAEATRRQTAERRAEAAMDEQAQAARPRGGTAGR